MQLDHKTFIVTGGASGLGAATASALIERGSRVIVGDLSGDAPDGAVFMRTDVTDEDSVALMVDHANAHGDLVGVVNCAGITVSKKTVDGLTPHDLSSFAKVVNVNLVGTFNVIRLAAAAMAGNEPGEDGERGVVINTASIAAFEGRIGQAAYAASKAGIAGLTLPLARDLASLGIRVVAIAPGLFLTPMLAGVPAEALDAMWERVPFPARPGEPSEYADLVVSIITNRMLNGEVIRLDGAFRLGPH